MDKVFAVSDIHGCYPEFNEMIKDKWNPDNEQLVLMGDYIDRGVSSYPVMRKVMQLKREYGAIVLGGNHEDMLLSFLDNPESERSIFGSNGGIQTIDSFIHREALSYPSQDIADIFKQRHGDILEFIENMPNYYEHGEYVFVHAGVDLHLKDWKNTKRNDYRWIRSGFHNAKNETGKKFLFGHTPTQMLHRDGSNRPWFSKCATKIGIDGGCVFGGLLNGARVSEEGISFEYIESVLHKE